MVWLLTGGDTSSQNKNIVKTKAQGMTAIAEKTQLNRQNLYKSLSANANPSFETINKVLHALGLKLQVSTL